MNRIQHILDEQGATVFPGVYDALSALIAERAGFPMAFVSGYAVSATRLGEPDHGLLTQSEVIDQARNVCNAVTIPVIVDADTGYGNAVNVQRTVHELIRAGAAGCFIEDQVWPKRCGHMRGKQVVSRGEFLGRIRAAVDARGDADFFIVARSDARAPEGLEEAIERVTAARAAGADGAFVEAPQTPDELAEVGRRVPGPLVANMIEGGRTPLASREELARLGFELILYPLTGLYAAAQALAEAYEALAADGTSERVRDRLMDFGEFYELIGAEARFALAERYAADDA